MAHLKSQWLGLTVGAVMVASLILGLSACQPTLPPAPAMPPPYPVTGQPATPNPVDLAEQHSAQAQAQLQARFRDPAFNGYGDLVELAGRADGLRAVSEIYSRSGEAGLREALPSSDEQDEGASHPLFDDLTTLSNAILKPALSAPIDLDSGGDVEIPDSAAFVSTLEAMALIPLIEARHPLPEDRLPGTLFTIKAGRKVAREAVTFEHYRAGLALQQAGTAALATVLSEELDAFDLQQIIASLQQMLGSDQELLFIYDTEYLLSTRRLAALELDPATLATERLGLAVRFLKLRPYFVEPSPKTVAFASDEVAELVGCRFALEQDDHLEAIGHWQRAASSLAALEVKAGLELYRQQHGHYPTTLDALVPGSLSRLPADKLNSDGAFSYQRLDATYRLTSSPVDTDTHGKSVAW